MPKNEIHPNEKFLTEAERARLSSLINKSSLQEIAKRFQVAPATLRTLAAGLSGHRGTLRLVRDGLKEEK